MTTTMDIFRSLRPEVVGTDLQPVWLEQLKLAGQLTALSEAGAAEVATVPPEVLGTHTLQPDKLNSTTGWVGFTDSNLAIKLGSLMSERQDQLETNNHFLYYFDDPRVRVMSAIGEALACNTFNQENGSIHLGVANVSVLSAGVVELSPFDLADIIAGRQDVALVMKKMDSSLFDRAEQVSRVGRDGATTSQMDERALTSLSIHLLHQLMDKGVPLEPDEAYRTGSPRAIQQMLTEDTPGWFAGRTETPLQPFARVGQAVIAEFHRFLAVPDTVNHLHRRAVGELHHEGRTTVAQGYFGGDQKLDNILVNSEMAGFSDLIWLIVRANRLANKNQLPTFAPWAYHDVMQATAYMALQARALGLHGVVEALHQELRTSLGNEWTAWHDMYFSMLIAYKFMVQSAVTADNYLQYFDKDGQPKAEVPAKVREQVEVYPDLALKETQSALRTYAAHPAVA